MSDRWEVWRKSVKQAHGHDGYGRIKVQAAELSRLLAERDALKDALRDEVIEPKEWTYGETNDMIVMARHCRYCGGEWQADEKTEAHRDGCLAL